MTKFRPVKKIKQTLIQKAKLKKSYAKIKERELVENPETFKSVYPVDQDRDEPDEAEKPNKLELHPERQAMLDRPEAEVQQELAREFASRPRKQRQKRHRKKPFEGEAKLAEQRKADAEARKKAIEEGNRQRQVKLGEREKLQKIMAKARAGGKNGQRKLGLESKVLLEKVKRVVNE